MGLIFFIGVNGLILMALIALARKPSGLLDVWRAFVAHPLIFTYQLVFIGSCLVAGWGILSMGKLSWRIDTPWGSFESWALAGLVAVGCLVLGFAYSVYENDFKNRR